MAWHEPLRGGGFRGRYYDQDGKKQSALNADGKGFKTAREAKRAAEDAAAMGRRRATATGANKGNEKLSASMTWGEWWNILTGIRTFDDTETGRVEQSIVANHLLPRWGTVPLNEVKRADVNRWIKDDLKPRRGLSASYARRIIAVFSATFTEATAEEREILDVSPCTKLKRPPLPKKRKRYLSNEAKEQIGEHLTTAFDRALDFARRTGVRPGELAGLHADQLDFKRGWMSVTNVYVTGLKMIRPHPKNGHARQVPLIPGAITIANAALQGRKLHSGCGIPHTDGSRCDSVLVFLNDLGRVISPDALYNRMVRASGKTDVGHLTPYTARRGFGTNAADGGINAFLLAEFFGHASLEEANGYVQVSPQARQMLIDALEGPVGQSGDERGAEGDPQRSAGVVTDEGESPG